MNVLSLFTGARKLHPRSISTNMIGRGAARQIARSQWQFRIIGFEAYVCFGITDFDLLSLPFSQFVERYLDPAVFCLLVEKKLIEMPLELVDRSDCRFEGVKVSCGRVPLRRTSEQEIWLHVIYEPPPIDHSMPTYFWIGEMAEAI